jgi:hypothetical protein
MTAPVKAVPVRRRKPRVEINPKMQALFRRLEDEQGGLTEDIKKVIASEAAKLEWQISVNLIGIGAVDDGYLLANIRTEIGSKGLSAEVGAGAGLKDKNDKQWFNILALWLEHGTRPHAIGDGSSLRIGKKDLAAGKKAIQKGTMHPGQRARPFVRPAYELRRPLIIKRLEEACIKTLKEYTGSSPRLTP